MFNMDGCVVNHATRQARLLLTLVFYLHKEQKLMPDSQFSSHKKLFSLCVNLIISKTCNKFLLLLLLRINYSSSEVFWQERGAYSNTGLWLAYGAYGWTVGGSGSESLIQNSF